MMDFILWTSEEFPFAGSKIKEKEFQHHFHQNRILSDYWSHNSPQIRRKLSSTEAHKTTIDFI